MRPDRAQTIFQNGVLWTGIDGPTDATALAVADGRIAAVGSRDDVLALRGPDTRMVDLAGIDHLLINRPGIVSDDVLPPTRVITSGLPLAR